MLHLMVMSPLLGQHADISKILWAANWSSDGKYIAVGGVDKKITIFSGTSFERLKTIENGTAIQRFSWHPSCNLLAVAAIDNGSKIINVDTDSIITLKGDKGFGSRAVAWNHNGSLLANADYEGELTIWTAQGELVRTIKKDNSISYVAIDWHPIRNELIVLSERIRIYDVDGNLLATFKHRKEDVLMLCVKWHKSGKYFVIGDYGDNEKNYKPVLQYWQSTNRLIRNNDISNAAYRNVSWSKSGKLATASDALRIWNAKGKLIAQGTSGSNLWGVDWSPDGKHIVTSSHDGYVALWDSKANLIRELK